MIEVKNLTKRYGITVAVDDLSFSVGKGEVLGFLGPNGAGKSTTMKVLSCFIPATSGNVFIGGVDVLTHSLQIRKKIGYLPENNPLYDEVNVHEYLSFICDIRNLSRIKKRSRIDEVVEKCGLKAVLKKEVGELSKGFRQRVGLAQALVHGPEILILDEPTSGLDPNQVIEIRELIKTLGEEKTVMLSTHILPEVSATCSRIIIINDGKIVACDTAEELQKKTEVNTLIALIKGPLKKIKEKLGLVDSLERIEITSGSSDNLGSFNIHVSKKSRLSEESISELVFDIVVKNGWKLLELRWDRLSLEDVFHKLTMVEGK